MADLKRSYHAPVREAQAARTRERVVAAAAELFTDRGWLATTVADIAHAAGVTPQAVHNSVGGKPALLIEAVRASVAGNETDRPLAARSTFAPAYRADTPTELRAAAFASGARAVYERAAPLFMVLAQAAPADTILSDLWDQARANRLADCRQLIKSGGKLTSVERDRRTDLLFVYSGPGVYADWSGIEGGAVRPTRPG